MAYTYLPLQDFNNEKAMNLVNLYTGARTASVRKYMLSRTDTVRAPV